MEMSAAVGRAQLPKLPTHQKLRNANLAYFTRLAAEADLPITLPALRGAPSPFGLAFTLDDPTRRPRLAAALRARGIDCRPPTGGSFTRHPYGAPWRDANPTPVADRVHDAGLFLGCAPYPIEDLIERAVLVMQEVL
jgi:dTDP-4-amino-4,6-dideoxygalactose transaminase